MKNVKHVFPIILLILFLFFNCETYEYNQAMKKGTVEPLEEFVMNHPESDLIPSVLARIDTLDWINAVDSNSITIFQKYITRHPDGSFSKMADSIVDSLKWEQCSTSESLDMYLSYLKDYPKGRFKTDAANKIIGIQDMQIKKEPAITMYGMFSDGFIKYVDVINVRYFGNVLGVPAHVQYSIFAGKDPQGRQTYMIWNNQRTILEINAAVEVDGSINFEENNHGWGEVKLSNLIKTKGDNMFKSFLVSTSENFVHSDTTTVREIAKLNPYWLGDTRQGLELSAPMSLFKINHNFALYLFP